jgi:hypothetical protein
MRKPAEIGIKEWDKFLKVHTKYPEMYKEFVSVASGYIKSGEGRISAMQIVGHVRNNLFHRMKLREVVNNNFAPIMSRVLCEQRPVFKTFFEFRQIRKD